MYGTANCAWSLHAQHTICRYRLNMFVSFCFKSNTFFFSRNCQVLDRMCVPFPQLPVFRYDPSSYFIFILENNSRFRWNGSRRFSRDISHEKSASKLYCEFVAHAGWLFPHSTETFSFDRRIFSLVPISTRIRLFLFKSTWRRNLAQMSFSKPPCSTLRAKEIGGFVSTRCVSRLLLISTTFTTLSIWKRRPHFFAKSVSCRFST